MELTPTENLKDVEHFAASFVRGAFEKYEKPGSEMLKAIVEGTAGLLSAPSKFLLISTKSAADAGKTFYKYWDAKKTNLFQQKVKTIIEFESKDTFYDQFKKTLIPLAVHVYHVYERQLQTNIYLDTNAGGDRAQAVELLAAYAGSKCLEYMVEKKSLDSALEVLTMKSKLLEATSFCRLENYAKGNLLYFYENKETKDKIQISSYKFFRKAIPVFVVNKKSIHWDSLRIYTDVKKPMGARLRRLFPFENQPKDGSSFKGLPESVKNMELLPNYFWAKTYSAQVVNAIISEITCKVDLTTADAHGMIIAAAHKGNKNIGLVDTKVSEMHDDIKKLQATSAKEEAPIIVRSFEQFDEPTDFLTEPRNIVHRIHEQLKHCSKKSSLLERIVVLHGMGGIGKSELARMYARTYLEDKIIQNVAWINAESESSLKASFDMLANTLKLTTDPSNIKATVRRIYKLFSKNIGTGLFIFDNAPQMMKTENEFGIYEFLPTKYYKQRPLVLITSRKNLWQRIPAENKIEVKELSTEEAIEFIKNGLELTDEQRGENVNTAIRSLAENLRGYTLALVLATSNIRNKMWGKDIASSIEKYVERINNLKGGWPQDRHSPDAPTKYDLIMSNVWSATFEKIALDNKGEDALKLLNFMAFLPTDGITIEQLSDIFYFSYQKRFDEQSVLLLENYSINKVIPGTVKCSRIRIHRLVQLCARDKLDCDKDFTSLFRICNYLTAQKGDDYDFEEIKSCTLQHLTQRNWPGDSIKYPIIFSSLAIFYPLPFYSIGKRTILAVKSSLDLQNQNSSYVAPLKNVFDLFHLCLAFYCTDCFNDDEVFRNLSLRTKLKEVILLYGTDYVRYLVEGNSDNILCEAEKHSDFVTQSCYRVFHKILTENIAFVDKEFGIEFQIFENLVAHLSSSDQRPQEVVAVIKIYDLLWAHSKSACPVSAAQVIKCAVKKHRQLQPTLLSATNSEKQMYWLYGGPFVYCSIKWRMSEADWSRAFADAFFDEGGSEIIGQHLTYLSTSNDFKGLQCAFNHLSGIILILGSQCSSKLIRDADFMESFLVFSKHVFSLRGEMDWFFKHSTLYVQIRGLDV